MKNKKGFTLVELIGVVILIGLIALIAIPSVDYIITKTKNNAYNRTKDTLKDGLRNWVTDNKELIYEDGEEIIVTLADLKEQGYVEYEIKNPKTSTCLANTMQFKITRVKNSEKDTYEYTILGDELIDGTLDDCEAVSKTPSIYLLGDNPQKIEITNDSTLTYAAFDPGAIAKSTTGEDMSSSIRPTNNVNLKVLGKDYHAKYTIIEENGISKTVTRKVYVVDTTAPELHVPEDLEIEMGETLNLMEGVTATDNSGITPTIQTSGNVNFSKEGEYKVIYIATDKSGNSVQKERIIKVKKPYYFLQTYSASTSEFHSSTYEKKILTITFQSDMSVPDNAVVTWDLSEANNNKIIGYLLEDDITTGYYHMYVGSLGDIRANINFSKWFYNMTNLYEINFENFDTSSVNNMSNLFYQCSSLKKIDLSGFDTANTINMNAMFYGTTNLEEINFGRVDTSNVVNMDSMFYKSGVINLDLSGFDTSNVTNMRYMFGETHDLVSLDISNFNTAKVTNMGAMFYNSGMEFVNGIENFDTSLVSDMSSMFACPYAVGTCYNTKVEIDLSNFDTSGLTNIRQMFRGAKIKNINLRGFDIGNITSASHLFYGCNAETINLNGFNTSNVTDMSWMFAGANIAEIDMTPLDTGKVTTMADMFREAFGVKKVNLKGLNTSNVTNMSDMFYRAIYLNTLDMSDLDTSKVTSMRNMFYDVRNLTNLDVSNWDTSSVTNMNKMFYYASKLTNLDVSNWDTSKVTDMSYMFYDLDYLTSLDVSNWDTSSVTNMSYMFYNNYDLSLLDVSNWDTSNVTNMSCMFMMQHDGDRSQLTNLDVSNWKTTNVTNMYGMFSRLKSLKELDLSGWDLSNVTSMSNMFYRTEDMNIIKTPKNIPTTVDMTNITSYAFTGSDGNTYAAGTFPTGNATSITLTR